MSIQEYQLVINMLLNADIGKLSHANNNRVQRLNGTQQKDQSAVRMQETHFTIRRRSENKI
jgi:hypothetical protein